MLKKYLMEMCISEMKVAPRQLIKKQRHHCANKVSYSQSYSFSTSHVWVWVLDHKESWSMNNWCYWIIVLEKTPESPVDFNKIKPDNPKGNQSWIFTGRSDAEAENSNTLATWSEALTHWKKPCWERLKAGEGDDRGWDAGIASPTWWTWDWASSRSWWWTGKPGVL